MGLLTKSEAGASNGPPGAAFEEMGRSLTAISYPAGLAFVIAAIYKFKQYKDNPSQSPNDPLRLISAVWESIDETTAKWLTDSGYGPEAILDAAEQAERGDTADLMEFFADLHDYLKSHPEP